VKRHVSFLVIILVFIMILSIGCTKTESPAPTPDPEVEEQQKPQEEEPTPNIQNLKSYFLLTEGSTWKYQGEGNEYATFNRQVLFVEGDKAQVRENNGGTVSAAVFKTSENEIIRIFFQGEEYEDTNFLNEEPNNNLIILKTPLEVGTKWEDPNGYREIVEIDATVDTPAGKFENCIKVEITGKDSNMFEYFKEDIGMVKREFNSEGMTITSSLEEFKINK